MVYKRGIARVVNKASLTQQGTDYAFWQTRTYVERLTALEEIRQDYHRWMGAAESRLQRGYRISKR